MFSHPLPPHMRSLPHYQHPLTAVCFFFFNALSYLDLTMVQLSRWHEQNVLERRHSMRLKEFM